MNFFNEIKFFIIEQLKNSTFLNQILKRILLVQN